MAEAASVKAVQDYGMKILSGGADMILLSIGALADETFAERSVNVQKKMEERSTLLPVPLAVLMYCGLFSMGLCGTDFFPHKKGPKSLLGNTVVLKKVL